MAPVWSAAVDALAGAEQIIIIGYSMPITDTFLSYLIGLALARNPHLDRVVVVNLDGSDQLKDRYQRVFARSLINRMKLLFLVSSFAEFVMYEMHDVARGRTPLPSANPLRALRAGGG
jgi:hypothetical protein